MFTLHCGIARTNEYLVLCLVKPWPVDSRDLIVTKGTPLGITENWPETQIQSRSWFKGHPKGNTISYFRGLIPSLSNPSSFASELGTVAKTEDLNLSPNVGYTETHRCRFWSMMGYPKRTGGSKHHFETPHVSK